MNVRPYAFALMFAFSSSAINTVASESTETTRQLAQDLAVEGKHEAAAIEYRRLAVMEEQKEARSGYYWAAAHQYLKAAKPKLVQKMLDRAEDNSSTMPNEALFLRAQASMCEKKWTDAAFYLKTIIDMQINDSRSETTAKLKTAASRNLAHVFVAEKKNSDAETILKNAPIPCPEAIEAVRNYNKGHDHHPIVGGILGLIPGLGYAYSGEYANAARSLILNGLFIYALVDTADKEQWGAFAAVSFFELTWYTGSIYGGIDSAHRFNENRKAECFEVIDKGCRLNPDPARIPIITLNFDF